MDLKKLMFLHKASGGGEEYPSNFIDLKVFEANTNLTVNGEEVYGTINNFRNDGYKYALKKAIPSGTKVKCSTSFYCEQNETASGGMVFRLRYKDSGYVNVYTMLNSYSEWTPNTGTVTLEHDVDGFEIGWTNGPTNIMHMKDIKVEIVED